MVGEIGKAHGVDLALPCALHVRHAESQQGMLALRLQQPGQLVGGWVPVVFPLPGIRWQGDVPTAPGEEFFLTQRSAEHMGRAKRLHQPALPVVVLLQRRQRASPPAGGAQAFLNVSLQDRIRSDFQVNVGVLGCERLRRQIEANRLANVVPPVRGAELSAVQNRAGYGGHIGQSGRRCLQIREHVRQRRAHGLHEAAVKRVVELQDAEKDAACLQPRSERLKVFESPADRDRSRTVDGGELHLAIQRAQLGGNINRRHGHRRHATQPAGRCLGCTARVDSENRVLQAQRAGSVGGCDLSDAVSEGSIGLEAVCQQCLENPHLQREQRGLSDLGEMKT